MCHGCDVMRAYAATTTIPKQDWLLHEIEDFGPSEYYRYRVTGENLNWPPDEPERHFTWRVRDLDDPRYDVAHATRMEGRRES